MQDKELEEKEKKPKIHKLYIFPVRKLKRYKSHILTFIIMKRSRIHVRVVLMSLKAMQLPEKEMGVIFGNV